MSITHGDIGVGSSCSALRSFTLIETLAVVILLSIAAGTTLVRLSAAGERAQLDQLTSRIIHLDQMARAAARNGRSVVIERTDTGVLHLIELNPEGHIAPEVARLAAVEPARQDRWAIGIGTGDSHPPSRSSPRRIAFDARGCSIDYSVHVLQTDPQGDSHGRTLQICGLTGWVQHDASQGGVP